MQVIYLEPGGSAMPADSTPPETATGYYWLDIERSEAEWYREAGQWLDTHLHDHHLVDSLNDRHLPHYDGTDDYDLLLLRTLNPASPTEAPLTRPVAMFVTPRVVVSVRPRGDAVFERVKARLLAGRRKAPASPVGMLALLIGQVVDQLLERREAVGELLGQWQDHLLAADGPFDDWPALARLRAHLRRLEDVSERQLDALSAWREQTAQEVGAAERRRFDELQQDLQRLFDHAAVMQADIDALVQIHYAAMGQRTNEVLRVLTVISVVFLPLNLVAGIFGMNFVHLPFLQAFAAPWAVVALMLALGAAALVWLRRKGWF